ncbi:MAG: caspase family protein, partial [Nitrospirae bacterium]|nr:caspase family protein [Nitrospirota bacterium]
MRRRTLFSLLLLTSVLVSTAPVPADQRGVKIEGKDADQYVAAQYGTSWAVVIGINDYQHQRVPKLQYAVNDAVAVERALVARGFRQEHIIKLLDREATKTRIETVLGDDLRQQVGQNDRVLVFFAGHGKTDRLRSGEEEGYLIPVDGDPSKLFSTAVSMSALRQISERLSAKHILYVVDSCYSGYALFNRGISDDLLEEIVKKPAIQILTAGRQQDQAQERNGHGVFTEVLLRGLEGDAFAGKNWLSLEELGVWMKQRVYVESNRKQVPQYGNLSGEGQFVFVKGGVDAAKANRPGGGGLAPPSAPALSPVEGVPVPSGPSAALTQKQQELAALEEEARRAEDEAKQAELDRQIEAKKQQIEEQKKKKLEVASLPTPSLPRQTGREITGKDGAPMVLVPEGEFQYGDNNRRLSLSAFYMDKYEVSTAQYAKFMA